MYGWTGKILEVDLTAGKVGVKDGTAYAREYIGGRALAARIAWEEIPAGIDAYDAENRVIITTGPFTGTLSPTSGRTVMSGISPRPYPKPWYTHSTLGGWFGPQLKYAGYDGIVIHGKAQSPVYIEIRDDKVAIRDAADLWGSDARQTQLTLLERAAQKAQILAIGPAGENRVRFSTVQHAEENAAGHSGFGAVWGSKNLKAISVTGTHGIPVADPQALLQEAGKTRNQRYSNLFGFLYDTGKSELTICSQSCVLDCFGNFVAQLPDGRRFSANCLGAAWTHPQFGWMNNTRYSGGGVDVPAAHSFEAAAESPLHELCNSLGLDLWFRMVMQPWFIRCEQLGIRAIRGHQIDPTNVAWFEQFMRQLAAREGLGDVFAEDLIRAMDELEGELPPELIGLGRELEFNFGFPAHREGRIWDGEPLPFWVISAMMHVSESRDPTIGSHLSSLLLAELVLNDEPLARKQFRVLSQKVWGRPEALDPGLRRQGACDDVEPAPAYAPRYPADVRLRFPATPAAVPQPGGMAEGGGHRRRPGHRSSSISAPSPGSRPMARKWRGSPNVPSPWNG